MPRLLLLAVAAGVSFPILLAGAEDKPLGKLIEAISRPAEEAGPAIDEVGTRGPAAKIAVPALIRALAREEGAIRWRAARTLAALGPTAASAVPALTKALSDPVPEVRAYAAYALGKMGPAAEPAVGKLIEIALDKEAIVRRASIRALREINAPIEKTLPLVEKVLEEADPALLTPALHSMAESGKAAVPRLRQWLKQPKATYWACLVLAEIGPDAAEAVPELTEVLKREEPEVRLQALVALGDIGAASKPAVPAILGLLQKDPFEGVRYAAVYALVRVGEKNAAINQALQEASKHKDPLLKLLGVWGLARLNPTDEKLAREATEAIIENLKSDNEQLRRAAARALREFHGPREMIRSALIAALKDADKQVVGHALDALASLGPKGLTNIDQPLQDKQLRHLAAGVVYRMGETAAPAVPALVAALRQPAENEDDLQFRKEVQFALAAVGPAAKDAVPELIKSLSSPDQEVRGTACYALGKIGPAAKEATRPLVQKLQEGEASDKVAVVWALLKIAPGNQRLMERAAPLLIRALNSDKELVRAEAARALGDLGELAKPAVERLKRMLDDESQLVRDAAAEALKKLGAG